MTWTVTLDSGDREVVLPNGLRYQGTAEAVLSDRWYAQLSASALESLAGASYLGGIAAYTVTMAEGASMVVLPDGLAHKAGDQVLLSDEQYSLVTPSAAEAFFSSVVTTVA